MNNEAAAAAAAISTSWMRGDAPEPLACRVFCHRALFSNAAEVQRKPVLGWAG